MLSYNKQWKLRLFPQDNLMAVMRWRCRLARWSQIVRPAAVFPYKTNSDNIQALELCISDKNKPLLVANKGFIPYVVDALLLDPAHPRAGDKQEERCWCQTHHAECLAQLAASQCGLEALRQNASVVPALEAVAKRGLSAEARHFAEAALLVLSGKELHVGMEGQKHLMLSCECG